MKIISVLLCVILIIVSIPLVGTTELLINQEFSTINENSLNGGWLEERDGVKIIHLTGSSYDMGYQHGVLLKDEIQENMRAMFSLYEQEGWSYNDVLEVWEIQKHYLPDEYKQEIQGMADGAGLSFEQVSV